MNLFEGRPGHVGLHTIRRRLLRLASCFHARRTEADLEREISAHLQLLEDKFVAQGMNAVEAQYAAKRAFGGVEQAKELQRDARSFRVLDHCWLDFKLGVRMLIKYPGLTVIGGLGMAVAVALAAGAFSAVSTLLNPALPFDEGDRIVSIQNWDLAAKNPNRRVLHDFIAWRHELKSVQDVSAFRMVARNLIAPGGYPETVRIAEMSASGFRVARVSPRMGRYLLEEDEREGAPAVVVIGYEVWRRRFASDPAIVGRTLQLGNTKYSVVGVMPEGFEFPVSHRFWVPLHVESSYAPLTGPEIMVFARLAPGFTIEAAQSELSTIGHRASAEFRPSTPLRASPSEVEGPKTHAQLRPQVLPYTYPFLDMDEPENALGLHVMQLLVTLLLIVVCVNVAMLVYARTATRQAEIAVRSALGASRGRIVGQLFIEALVLSGAAALAGIAIAMVALRQVDTAISQMASQLPFWLKFDLSSGAVIYAVALTLVAAAIVGVVPGLKATGRRVQTGLRIIGAGGSGMQLGKTWTVLIVAQVGVAVALLSGAVFNAWDAIRYGIADPGPAAREFLTAQLVMDQPAPSTLARVTAQQEFSSRYRDRYAELVRRLENEATIADVTFALSVPGEEATVWIEVEGVKMPSQSEAEASGSAVRSGTFGHEIRFNYVDVAFFDAFDVPILTGRGFARGDIGSNAVIVNRSFVEKILGGSEALGRRIRYVGASGDARQDYVELGRWYDVVGVVPDFPANPTSLGLVEAKLYHAAIPGDVFPINKTTPRVLSMGRDRAAPGRVYPVNLALRGRGDAPKAFAGRLRQITAAVDADLQLRNIFTMDEILRREQRILRLVAAGLAIVTFSVLLLSAAGIYALMSFTIAQRRKEIGIRTALGADSRRLLGSIFFRALRQIAIGVAVGVVSGALLERLSEGDLLHGNGAFVIPAVATLITAVGLLATLGPARRALRVDPIEVLREE